MEIKLERPLVWKPEFSTGVPIIDDQHRVLINMLNDANTRLTDRSRTEDFGSIVQGLLNYAGYHFGTEERFMSEYGYLTEATDAADLHVAQHRDFAGKVAAVQARLAAGKRISKTELVEFLTDWLVNHILDTDKKLGEFICAKKA